MGLVCPELSLDLRPSFVPESINGFLKQVSSISDVSERLNMVDDFVRRLEDEMNKIHHVFKRELPLCMLLLKDAIMYLKQETTTHKTSNAHQPVLEEFIPLNKDSIGSSSNSKTGEDEEDYGRERDKKNWMSSVQLWSSDDSLNNAPCHTHNQSHSLKGNDKNNQIVRDDDPCKIKPYGYGPLLHTHHSYPTESMRKLDKVAGLSLLVPGTRMMKMNHTKQGSLPISSNCNSSSSGRPSSSSARKQRRCWSPELHRRFVDALSHLGGPQVATPKQIRELMRVDGLTNDEVKSHLQKYRLHTRRVPNESGTSGNKNGQGGLSGSWTAQDQFCESSKPSRSQSGSPEGPHQFPGLTGGTSTTGADSIGDEDDEKSESYSWKGYLHRPGKDADDV